MKLGYFTLTDNPPAYGLDRKDPSRLLEEVMAQCLHAEDIGLNSVWVPEHYFGLFGVLPSAPVFLDCSQPSRAMRGTSLEERSA